jgi:glycosyltransferase involved in cell wall biosynthesis
VRILHCILSMTGGGAERQLAYLASALVERGHEVHVALAYGGENLERLQSTGCIVHLLKARVRRDPVVAFRLFLLVRRIRPDLIQTWLTHMDIIGGAVARLFHIPWIVSERSSTMAYEPTLLNRLRSRVASGAAAVIPNSEAGAHYWRNRPAGRRMLRVIPNALPMDEIEKTGLEDAWNLGAREVVLFVGRFSPEKNVEGLLAALRLVLSRTPAMAVLCGEGPLLGACREKVREWGLADRILMPGHVAGVWTLMKRASVLAAVGFYEGHPNVALEAVACGLPLVLSDISAHREFVGEDAALFVDPGRPDAIASAIENVLADRSRARKRAETAGKTVEIWPIAKVATAHEDVYRDVLGVDWGGGCPANASIAQRLRSSGRDSAR